MRDKSSLRHHRSLIGLIINPPEQATKYHKHEGENGRPGSRSSEKVFVQEILKHTLLLGTFVLAALSYGCCVICIWHGLEFSNFRFLLLAGFSSFADGKQFGLRPRLDSAPPLVCT
jgi:hypothetical protein